MRLSGAKLQGSIHRAIAFGRLHLGTNSCGRFSDQLARIKPPQDKLNHLDLQLREKVEARAAQLIAEEMTRRELRPQALTGTPREGSRHYPGWGFASGKAHRPPPLYVAPIRGGNGRKTLPHRGIWRR
jgi:hypothetical protein